MLRPIATTALLLAVTACGTTGTGLTSGSSGSSGSASTSGSSSADSRIAALEAQLASRNTRISALEGELSSSSKSDSNMMAANPGDLFPPNARPGECYARILLPEKYTSAEERVLVKEASETVSERVMVRAASKKIVKVPATFRTVSERVLDKPAYTVWKKGSPSNFGSGANVVSQSVNGTGEVMCLVEVPASYKTISKQVVDTPPPSSVAY